MKSIVIGRDYGSGGHNVGKKLSEDLGYGFYEKELVELAAKKENFNPEAMKKIDEKAKGSFLYSIVMGGYTSGAAGGPLYYDMPINDKLFIAQSNIIKEKASERPCVFVGRCADYVLRNAGFDILSVFLYSDLEYKINNMMMRRDLTRQEAKDRIQKTEKQRRAYYDYYTNNEWGTMRNYDICLNVAILGEEKCVEIIKCIVEANK